jgi:exodeoxyribonuclease VII large subunit
MTAYHPHAVLNRGYTITRNARGDIIRNVGAVQQRERLTITFAQGAADVAVESLSP